MYYTYSLHSELIADTLTRPEGEVVHLSFTSLENGMCFLLEEIA